MFRANGQLKKIAPRLLISLALMAVTLTAQTKEKQRDTLQDLKLELSITSETHCAGSKLPLKLKITNQSDRDVPIAKLGVWLQFWYRYIGADGKETEAGAIFEPDWTRIDLPENSILLKQKESCSSTSEFFESRKGKYALKLLYNRAESNQVEFEIVNCDQNNLRSNYEYTR